jgi:hypothetical protein
MGVEDEFPDVLQNIEFAIVGVFERIPDLADRDVLAAVEVLINGYSREGTKRERLSPGPPGVAKIVYQQCWRMCEWRLGRQPLNDGESAEDDSLPSGISLRDMIRCLKRLRKSIRMWHQMGGRQGYLNYVSRFIGDAAVLAASARQHSRD